MNLDPIGPVPEADANNRLVLDTDGGTSANAIFAAVASSIMAVLTIGFFYMRFVRGLPPRWDDRGLAYGALIGTLFIPLAVYCILSVLYPAQLEINDKGLVYQARGRTKKMPWAALQRISLIQVNLSKTLNTKTQTQIIGRDQKITFMPDFGVSPSDLAHYIAERQKLSGVRLPIIWEGTIPQSAVPPKSATKPNELRSAVLGISGGILAVLLVIGFIFAILFLLVVYQVMRIPL